MDLILIIVIIVIPLIAQANVKSTYKKYSKELSSCGLTGKEVAKKILEMNGIPYVKVERVGGELSDHYNPKNKTVNLSDHIYSSDSISAISVAAHECGHAIQDKEAYAFLRFRSALVPVVNFTSRIASILILLSFLLEIANLLYLAILLMLCGLLFQLVTLPVEYDASNRAKKQLQKLGLINKQDKQGVNKVLGAAALTYVASFLATALQVLRLVLINRRR